jgi:RNA polymerase sigma factor (sigma-70 family)
MDAVLGRIQACIPALRRYGHVLLRNEQEVDDLVHDCLVRALERLHTRRENGDVRAWLFAIRHNLFASQMRRRKTHITGQSIGEVDEITFGLDPVQDLHLEADDLLRAVDNLPEVQRSVLLLVTVEDLSYAQVAEVLNIPLGTVMSRLARARDRLARGSQVGASPLMLRRVK